MLGKSGSKHKDDLKLAQVIAGGIGMGSVAATIGIFCGMCWGFYCCVLQKNDGCLMCSGVCDGICAGATLLTIIFEIVAWANDGVNTQALVSMIINIIFVGVLMYLLAGTLMLRTKIIAERQTPSGNAAAPGQVIVGQPVVGQPVV